MLGCFHCVPCKLRRRASPRHARTPISREPPLSPAPLEAACVTSSEGLLQRPQCRTSVEEADLKKTARAIQIAKASPSTSCATGILVAFQLALVIFTSYSGLRSGKLGTPGFLKKHTFSPNEVAVSEFNRVVKVCEPAHGSDLAIDSVLLSGMFLLKQVFPTVYGSTPSFGNLVNQTVGKYQESLVEVSKTCSSLESADFMAHVDLWYFSTMDSSFGPSVRPPKQEFLDCVMASLPGGRKYREPKSSAEHVMLFINTVEVSQILHKLQVTPSMPLLLQSDALKHAIDIVYEQAEQFFQGDACNPDTSEGELCAYYYTHRLLKMTHLMSKRPDALDKYDIKMFTSRLVLFMNHWMKRVNKVGHRISETELDLIGEAAFVLKAVSCKPDSDPLVRNLVQTLAENRRSVKASADSQADDCHAVTTIFMGLQPSTSFKSQTCSR